MEEKKYCQISNDSIQMWAESVGITDLSSDILKALASDVTYRLNQTLSISKSFMRHCKRKKLTCQDINRTLKWMDVPPVEGITANDNTEWVHVPEIGVYDITDPNVNFFSTALSGDIFYQTGVTFTKAEWAYVSHHKLKEENSVGEKRMIPLPLANELVQYYKTLFSVIVTPSSPLFEVMLKDVGTSPNIGPLVGTIINGILRGTQVARQKTTILRRLLLVIRALIFNPNIHLGPHQYIREIVNILVFYTIKDLKIVYDTQSIRTLASTILLKLMRTKEDSAWDHAVLELGGVIASETRSWGQHAGALNALLILGPAAFYAAIYPILRRYTQRLSRLHRPSMSKEALDIQTANGLFLNGLVKVITFLNDQLPDRKEITVPVQSRNQARRIKIEIDPCSTELTTEKDVIQKIAELYSVGEDMFGAPFVMQIPPILLEWRASEAILPKCEYKPIIKPALVDKLRRLIRKTEVTSPSAIFRSYRRIDPFRDRLIYISDMNSTSRQFLRRRSFLTPFQTFDRRRVSLNAHKSIRLTGPMPHLAFKKDFPLKRIEDISIMHRTIL